MKKFILISMVLLCLIMIFLFSSESGNSSMSTTIKVSNIINYNSENNSYFLLRKSGHFIEFFTLEILVLGTIVSFRKSSFKCFILSLLFCLAYAISDEIHQLFVIGRSAKVMDVCIDFCGSVFGGIIFFTIYYIYKEGFTRQI